MLCSFSRDLSTKLQPRRGPDACWSNVTIGPPVQEVPWERSGLRDSSVGSVWPRRLRHNELPDLLRGLLHGIPSMCDESIRTPGGRREDSRWHRCEGPEEDRQEGRLFDRQFPHEERRPSRPQNGHYPCSLSEPELKRVPLLGTSSAGVPQKALLLQSSGTRLRAQVPAPVHLVTTGDALRPLHLWLPPPETPESTDSNRRDDLVE
jgi:hypothetical protein